MRYTFKNKLPGHKHVLEIQMQCNIHMQYNSVTFLYVQYSKSGHKYMLGNAYILPKDIIYIYCTHVIFLLLIKRQNIVYVYHKCISLDYFVTLRCIFF